MIRIIKGAVPYSHNGRKNVLVTEADGPLEFDSQVEARLVAKGVAEYVGTATAKVSDEDPYAYDEDTKLPRLKEIATALGVTEEALKTMRSKAQVIDAIEAAKAVNADDDEDEDDDEQPPKLGANGLV